MSYHIPIWDRKEMEYLQEVCKDFMLRADRTNDEMLKFALKLLMNMTTARLHKASEEKK
jgi:hypothetical protein